MNLREHKLRRLIVALLSEGITPHKIALTVALGVLLGITPMFGVTTILCAIAALVLRLNLPLIQLMNFLAYPLQLLLLIPFIDAGQWLFHAPPLPFTLAQLTGLLRTGFWHSLNMLWMYSLHALVAWLVFGGSAALLVYLGLRPVFGMLLARKTAAHKSRTIGL